MRLKLRIFIFLLLPLFGQGQLSLSSSPAIQNGNIDICLPQSSSLSLQASFTGPAVDSVVWDLAGAQNPKFIGLGPFSPVYLTAGDFQSYVKVWGGGALLDQDSFSVRVGDSLPQAQFASSGSLLQFNGEDIYTVCTNDNSFRFYFQNLSSGYRSYSIDFGDGSALETGSTWDTTNHLYTQPGIYTVILNLFNGPCPGDSDTLKVFFGRGPAAQISSVGNSNGLCIDPITGTATMTYNLSNFSQNPAGTLYRVYFSDDSTTQVFSHPPPPTISHTYSLASCAAHSPTYNNSFFVRFSAENPCGSSAPVFDPITISSPPTADFSMPLDSCRGSTVSLINISDPGSNLSFSPSALNRAGGNGDYLCDSTTNTVWEISPSTYIVDRGQIGFRSNLNNPNTWVIGSDTVGIRFTQAGTYTVKMVISGSSLCAIDSITKTICIDEASSGSYALSDTLICTGQNLNMNYLAPLVTTCLNTSVSWQVVPNTGWTIMSGGLNDTALGLSFHRSGNYQLIFEASNACGASRDTVTLRVVGSPLVQLPADTTICGLASLNLNDPSRPIITEDSLGSNTYTWQISPSSGWTFTAGTNANSRTPIIDFQSFGNYQLILEADNGCFQQSDTLQVNINSIPLLNIPNDTLLCSGSSFSLNLGAQQGSLPYSFAWQTQGGSLNPGGSIQLNNLSSDQKILVYLSDAAGCVDSGSFWLRVSNISTQVQAHPPVCYNDSTQLNVSIGGGSGSLNFRWLGAQVAHLSDTTVLNPWVDSLGIPGTYILEVSDSLGCLHYDTINLSQHPYQNVNAGPDTLVCDGPALVDLNYAASPTGGAWSGAHVNVQGQFNAAQAGLGVHRVYYSYQDGNSCLYLDSLDLTVIASPSGNFNLSDTATCVGSTITATSTAAPILNHQWFLNDSLIGSGLSISFSPANSSPSQDAIYTVKLVVGQAGLNCRDTISRSLIIYPKPQAAFSLADTVCAGDTLLLSSTSLFKGTQLDTLVWTTSAGLSVSNTHLPTSELIIPDQQGGGAQTYSVQLFVRSVDGCSDTLQQNITVVPRPSASFSLAANGCGPVSLLPQNLSSGIGLNYTWTSNPAVAGTMLNTASPQFDLPISTNDSVVYRIFLSVTDAGGCGDTFSLPYTVYPKPSAAFSLSNRDSCGPINLQISNLSSSGQSGLGQGSMSFTWDLGNGQSSGLANPGPLLYSNSGNTDSSYYVQLIAQNSFACSDTLRDSIIVRAAPNASLITTGFSDCAPFVIDSSIVRAIEWAPQSNYDWQAFDPQGNPIPGTSFNGPKAFAYTITAPEDSILLRLIVSRPFGCAPDTLEQWYYSLANPVSAFGLSDTAGCSPLNIQLSDSSQAAQTRQWFLDGSPFSTQLNPSLNLQHNGSLNDTTFQISLVVSSSNGCADTSHRTVTVYGSSIANFSASVACEGDTISFTDLSQSLGSIIHWQWDFGDGNNDTLPNPSHLYAGVGPHQVTLTVTDDRGCSASFSDTVEVYPFPLAAFGKLGNCEPLRWCRDQSISLSDSSTVASAGAPITNWYWDVDEDGIDDYTVQNPNHTYTSTGFKEVRLIVETAFGCRDTAYRTFKVIELPQSDFSFDTVQACGPYSVNLSNSSTGRIDARQWTIFTRDAQGNRQVMHTDTNAQLNQSFLLQSGFREDTTYYFELISSNCCGADTLVRSITLAPHPVAAFLPSANVGCAPFPVNFQIDGLTTGAPNYLVLDYGDGQVDTLNPSWIVNPSGDSVRVFGQPTHLYQNPSAVDTTYYPSLRAVNDCGDSTVSLSITVRPSAVQAFMQASVVSGCAPLQVSFTDFSFGGTSVSWCLDWDPISGSCNQPVNSGTTISTTYQTAGTYIVAQFVDDGCSYDTAFQVITVNPSPLANFSSNNFVCEGDSVFFNDLSTPNGGFISSYRWYFGDGDSSTLTSPVHIYDTAGVMEVVLIIQSSNACPDTFSQSITIFDKPEVNFGYQNACFNQQPLQFSDSTTLINGSIVGTLWDFGDGNTSTSLNPQHSYASPGLYTVTLSKTSSNGCVDSAQLNVNVYPQPVANYRYQRLSGDSCSVPQVLQFTSTSSGAQGFYWDFDFANNPGVHTATVANPQFQFNQYGIYEVALIVSNAFGCSDTIIQMVSIRPAPEAGFSATTELGCEPLAVQFVDTSNYNFSGGAINSWTWDFGDGKQSNDPNPQHIYLEEGFYTPSLIVQTDGGCSDTILGDPIRVYPTPSAGFEMEKLTAREVQFTSLSGNIDSSTVVLWDFGDGTGSGALNPRHRFPYDLTLGPRNVEVCLYLINGFGCGDTICQELLLESLQLNVPSALAPDVISGTESNVFLPKGHSLLEYRLRIYDRWGNIVFETTALDEEGKPVEAWDGTHQGNGSILPMGAYTWRIDAVFNDGSIWLGQENGRTRKNIGSVTLIR